MIPQRDLRGTLFTPNLPITKGSSFYLLLSSVFINKKRKVFSYRKVSLSRRTTTTTLLHHFVEVFQFVLIKQRVALGTLLKSLAVFVFDVVFGFDNRGEVFVKGEQQSVKFR